MQSGELKMHKNKLCKMPSIFISIKISAKISKKLSFQTLLTISEQIKQKGEVQHEKATDSS